ncbi:uncharacterized protein LOC129597196 [Paramacrobiotus metropolitanus]|uniref:uncharacterized protein LOC129597196 n=1 Tax=Paramacrobiotus metropolitanus TaxID=2943436 RepID=UPI00244561F3|nr:uncharacterized protein LOC129597196 [Paramacrobiotus metropolitanus]
MSDSRSFCAGDLILTCEPWVWGFDQKAYATHCAHCFQEKKELAICSGCQLHRYCNKTCQVSDWKTEHKFECAMLKKLGGRMKSLNVSIDSMNFSGSRPLDLMAKTACKIKRNATMNLGELGPVSAVDILRLFPTYEAVATSRESANRKDHGVDCPTSDFIGTMKSFLGLSSSEFSEYYNIAGHNALAMFDILGTHHPFGHALYPQAPFRAMTPACWDVNVVLNFVGRRLVIHATQDIPNYTGLHNVSADHRYSLGVGRETCCTLYV